MSAVNVFCNLVQAQLLVLRAAPYTVGKHLILAKFTGCVSLVVAGVR